MFTGNECIEALALRESVAVEDPSAPEVFVLGVESIEERLSSLINQCSGGGFS